MTAPMVKIRKARTPDVAQILSIQRSAFQRYVGELRPEQIPPLHETAAEARHDLRAKSFLVADIGTIAGSVRYTIRGGVCHIERLSVMPAMQGQGIGKALLSAVEQKTAQRAHKLYLETGALADNLIAFYTKLGFSVEARFCRHYGGFDWIAFSKFPERMTRSRKGH
ncbi:MAG TPA: GNAT family N-acetyltransferase [Dissulfurispiraceae bacterium]|nr:GNAT family N-acetyltransferase [Dissulfurispiraceae bacterium]